MTSLIFNLHWIYHIACDSRNACHSSMYQLLIRCPSQNRGLCPGWDAQHYDLKFIFRAPRDGNTLSKRARALFHGCRLIKIRLLLFYLQVCNAVSTTQKICISNPKKLKIAVSWIESWARMVLGSPFHDLHRPLDGCSVRHDLHRCACKSIAGRKRRFPRERLSTHGRCSVFLAQRLMVTWTYWSPNSA